MKLLHLPQRIVFIPGDEASSHKQSPESPLIYKSLLAAVALTLVAQAARKAHLVLVTAGHVHCHLDRSLLLLQLIHPAPCSCVHHVCS